MFQICQSRPILLPNNKYTVENLQRLVKFCQIGEISPNLVTLVVPDIRTLYYCRALIKFQDQISAFIKYMDFTISFILMGTPCEDVFFEVQSVDKMNRYSLWSNQKYLASKQFLLQKARRRFDPWTRQKMGGPGVSVLAIYHEDSSSILLKL